MNQISTQSNLCEQQPIVDHLSRACHLVSDVNYNTINHNTDWLQTLAFYKGLNRVLCCLVNEKLVQFKLVHSPSNKVKHWVVLKLNKDFIYIPLKHRLLTTDIFTYMDPDDVMFGSLSLSADGKLNIIEDINIIFASFTDKTAVDKLVNEISNSIKHQYSAYTKYQQKEILVDGKLTYYEQLVIEGHPTHPMNKARSSIDLIKKDLFEYDFNNINILLYRVLRSEMTSYGQYELAISKVLDKLNIVVDIPDEYVIIAVHEMQKPVVESYFEGIHLLDVSIKGLAQCSLRTVDIIGVEDVCLKLSLAITTSSSLRTITPYTVFLGPNIIDIINKVVVDKELLKVEYEIASITSNNTNHDIAKHLSCIIRNKINEDNINILPIAFLTERYNPTIVDDEYNITRFFRLYTLDDRINFAKNYTTMALNAFLTPAIRYGFTFEAHLQNVLARVKIVDNQPILIGFGIRDFGGIKVHQYTLLSTIGTEMPVLDNEACVVAHDIEDVYKICYHTLFHCHLHRVFRGLGVHYNGIGWEIVRNYLMNNNEFMQNDKCKEFFLGKTVPLKCFLEMKFESLYRDYLYTQVPNFITAMKVLN